jgi:hypothetical protein
MNKMKFLMILCLSAILLLFSEITNAQQEVAKVETNVAKGIKLNFNAGFHFSNMIGKNVQKDDNLFLFFFSENGHIKYYDDYNLNAGGYKGLLPGCKFGVGVTFDVTKYFAWGFDLNYQTKGCRIPMRELIVSYYYTTTYPDYTSTCESKSFPVSNVYSKIRLNYIVIPVRAEFKYKKFYFASGLYTGFLLNSYNTTKFNFEDKHFDVRYNVSSHYSRIDLGVLLNAGFCFPVSKDESIKVGFVSEWNINGGQSPSLDGGSYDYFCNQVFGLELKYELKIK